MRRGKFNQIIGALLMTAACAGAQVLPRKIRGYTVYNAQIKVAPKPVGPSGLASDAVVTLGEPVLKQLSLAGITLEISAQVTALQQSGRIDFLTFRDFRVNGIAIDPYEYREPFAIKKGETAALPKPAVIFVPTSQLMRAALREMNESKKEWLITGRVFVFGKFRKYGFEYKRVVPVDIDLKIANPISR